MFSNQMGKYALPGKNPVIYYMNCVNFVEGFAHIYINIYVNIYISLV